MRLVMQKIMVSPRCRLIIGQGVGRLSRLVVRWFLVVLAFLMVELTLTIHQATWRVSSCTLMNDSK